MRTAKNDKRITSRQQLAERIEQLTARKNVLEAGLSAKANEAYDYIRHPAKFIRKCVSDLAFDGRLFFNIFRSARNAFSGRSSARQNEDKKHTGSGFLWDLLDFIRSRKKKSD